MNTRLMRLWKALNTKLVARLPVATIKALAMEATVPQDTKQETISIYYPQHSKVFFKNPPINNRGIFYCSLMLPGVPV